MPEIYAKRTKLYINDEDKTTIVDKNKLEYILPTYKTYEVVLEVEGITTKTKTAEITGQEITEILNWDTSKIDIRREEDGRAVPIPKGFEVLTTAAKPQGYTIDEGLVITNGGNEFVWVPVTSPGEFTEDSFGPIEETLEIDGENVKTDSYKTIQYYYGNALGTMNSDADFDAVFTYEADRENVERSIRTYGGFYVGRYETTYDSLSNGVPQGIGVKKGKDVLVANSLLKPGTDTKPASGTNYFYRWWGLYKVQKDMYAENSNVGSLMISGPQWYAIMKYTQYEYAIRSKNTYTNLDENGEVTVQDKSGSAYNGNPNQYDEAKNIYDLAGNVNEWTINQYSGKGRGACGGNCFYPAYASVWGSHAPTLVHVYPRF